MPRMSLDPIGDWKDGGAAGKGKENERGEGQKRYNLRETS